MSDPCTLLTADDAAGFDPSITAAQEPGQAADAAVQDALIDACQRLSEIGLPELGPAPAFDRAWDGVSKNMTEGVPGFDRSRPIEEWSDEELLEEFRYLKAELSDEDPEYRDADGAPADVIEEEMKRRGLEPDREDVIPDAASPGREEEPRVRG